MNPDDEILCPVCQRPGLTRADFGTRPDGNRRSPCKMCDNHGRVLRRKRKRTRPSWVRAGLFG